jgi:RimJ/RimL family protein N-acetyltransferase
VLSFIQRDYLDFPDFGFALLPNYQQKGFALEAASIYLSSLFQTNQYSKIIAICMKENQSSINLLKKLGFKYDHSDIYNGKKLQVYDLNNSLCIKL